jgi:hypothetical protein
MDESGADGSWNTPDADGKTYFFVPGTPSTTLPSPSPSDTASGETVADAALEYADADDYEDEFEEEEKVRAMEV